MQKNLFPTGGLWENPRIPIGQLHFPACLGLGQPVRFSTAASLETKVSPMNGCKAKTSKPSNSGILHQHQRRPHLQQPWPALITERLGDNSGPICRLQLRN